MPSASGGLTVLERLYPEEKVSYRGVTIVVTPLPFVKVPSLVKSFWNVIPKIADRNFTEKVLEEVIDDILSLLEECVTVPEDPSITIKQLPIGVIPDILEIFLDQSLPLGKWEALLDRAMPTKENNKPKKKGKKK